MKIESFIPGRVRLRSPLLKDARCAGAIADGLISIRGVERAEVNGRTGGLLLEYDSSAIDASKLISAAPTIERLSAVERAAPADRLDPISAILKEIKDIIEEDL